MLKLPIDQDELLRKMASEAVRKGEEVRSTVRDLTLKSLQGRDVTLAQIKSAIRSVTEGINMGAAKSPVDAEQLLSDALAGMDDALLKAVEANRTVLQQLAGDGNANFEGSKMKKALDELERYEDTMFRTVKQASAGAGEQLRTQWTAALKNMKMEGTDTGERVAATLEQYGSQFQNAVRDSRAAGFKVAHAMQSSYATLVGGALSGMSEALKQGGRSGRGSARPSGGGAGGGAGGGSSSGSSGSSGASSGSGGSSGSSGGSGGSGGSSGASGSAGSAPSAGSRSGGGSGGGSGGRSTAAKKTPAKKTAAKKTPAKKTAAKKAAAKRR